MTGEIKSGIAQGCDEVFEKVKSFLESSDVHFPPEQITGWTIGESTPGADDRDKLWLKQTDHGAYWYYWQARCGKWCGIEGIPGELVTRERLGETVQADVTAYYNCGWEIADGNNLLNVDLRKKNPAADYNTFELIIDPNDVALTSSYFEDEPILLATTNPVYTEGAPLIQSGEIDLSVYEAIEKRTGLYICVHPQDAKGTVALDGRIVWVSNHVSNTRKCMKLSLDKDVFPYTIDLDEGIVDIYYHGYYKAT